jgi:stage V sporulation protein S
MCQVIFFCASYKTWNYKNFLVFIDVGLEKAMLNTQTVNSSQTNSSAGKANVIKVSSTSRSTAVAGAIAGVMREQRFAEVQAIGPGAVNQAVKALAIARGYLRGDGIDLICVPHFMEIDLDGQERTVLRFCVQSA